MTPEMIGAGDTVGVDAVLRDLLRADCEYVRDLIGRGWSMTEAVDFVCLREWSDEIKTEMLRVLEEAK